MKQEVFVIGRNLRELVPFSLTFAGPDYSVTLVESDDVVRRAAQLARHTEAWFLLVLSGEEENEAQTSLILEELAPSTSMVIEDGEDPVIALAHLIAAATWEAAEPAVEPVPGAVEAKEQYG